MNRYILTALLVLLMAGSFFSCKKTTSSSVPLCNLTTITDSTTSIVSTKQFTYDNSGRILSINITGQSAGNSAYTYIGNMIIINNTDGAGNTTEIDSVVLNHFNEVQSYVDVYSGYDTVESGTYYYDSSGIVTSGTESLNGIVQDTATYNTINGDLNYKLERGQSVPVENYTYYNQSIVNGDPTNIKQLLYYGAYYYKNVHMVNEFYSLGVFYNNYKYTFSNNRIAQVTSRQWRQGSADTVTHTMQYIYSCQ